MFRFLIAFAVLVGLTSEASVASADDMDITLSRLRIASGSAGAPASCKTTGENGLPRAFCPDNDSFHRLMGDLGSAILATPTGPAATTGFGGFQLSLGGSFTGIDQNSRAWTLGTEGDQRSTETGGNVAPSGKLLIVYGEVRKGLPFGFELGASVGHVLQTGLYIVGMDAKWALFEGFRTGLGLLPDVALHGSIKTVVGDSEFAMTLPAVALIISKPFVIGRTWTLSPYVAAQVAWVNVDSDLVDLTPGVNAFDACVPDPADKAMACTKTPVQGEPLPGEDYNNNATFSSVRSSRGRLQVGAEGQFQRFLLSGVIVFDLTPPSDMPSGVGRSVSGMVAAGFSF